MSKKPQNLNVFTQPLGDPEQEVTGSAFPDGGYSEAEVEAAKNDPALASVLQMIDASNAETGQARLDMIRLAIRHARRVGLLGEPPPEELMRAITAGLPVRKYHGPN